MTTSGERWGLGLRIVANLSGFPECGLIENIVALGGQMPFRGLGWQQSLHFKEQYAFTISCRNPSIHPA
jgi:hypothetical protein